PRLWVATASVFAAAALEESLIHFREVPPRQPVVTFSVASPEKTVGMDKAGRSPGGRRNAFTATPRGATASLLYVRSLDTLAPRALKGTEGARNAFWSPDGRFLAFQTGGKLKKIDLIGGSPQVLCDSDTGGGAGAWSSAGVILFV